MLAMQAFGFNCARLRRARSQVSNLSKKLENQRQKSHFEKTRACDKIVLLVNRPSFQTFIGIDLGGARGKSTAVALLRRDEDDTVRVESVLVRAEDGSPWVDDSLLEFLRAFSPSNTAIAINAPLTAPACVRCTLQSCPGYQACSDPATVWLRTVGQELHAQSVLSDHDRIAAMPQISGFREPAPIPAAASQRLPPYTHRCTEVDLHYTRGLLAKEHMGQSSWAIASRAAHLRKVLVGVGFVINEALLEVSPRCTIQALYGENEARNYKRDADPWQTRAAIIEGMKALSFSQGSRLSREQVLRNDNCFDALVCGFTGFLWAREAWQLPEDGPFDVDGWIWAPPAS
jgi:hypothetical protein